MQGDAFSIYDATNSIIMCKCQGRICAMKLFCYNKQYRIRMQGYPILYYILSAFIPGIIIVVALAGLKITPFGDNTLAISDGHALYLNYLGYVGRTVKG